MPKEIITSPPPTQPSPKIIAPPSLKRTLSKIHEVDTSDVTMVDHEGAMIVLAKKNIDELLSDLEDDYKNESEEDSPSEDSEYFKTVEKKVSNEDAMLSHARRFSQRIH